MNCFFSSFHITKIGNIIRARGAFKYPVHLVSTSVNLALVSYMSINNKFSKFISLKYNIKKGKNIRKLIIPNGFSVFSLINAHLKLTLILEKKAIKIKITAVDITWYI